MKLTVVSKNFQCNNPVSTCNMTVAVPWFADIFDCYPESIFQYLLKEAGVKGVKVKNNHLLINYTVSTKRHPSDVWKADYAVKYLEAKAKLKAYTMARQITKFYIQSLNKITNEVYNLEQSVLIAKKATRKHFNNIRNNK